MTGKLAANNAFKPCQQNLITNCNLVCRRALYANVAMGPELAIDLKAVFSSV